MLVCSVNNARACFFKFTSATRRWLTELAKRKNHRKKVINWRVALNMALLLLRRPRRIKKNGRSQMMRRCAKTG